MALTRRMMRGMLWLTTLLIREAQWTQSILRILSGTKRQSLFINQGRTWSLHTLEKRTTYISGNYRQSPEFRSRSCVRMSTCAIAGLESEFQRTSAT